MTLQEAIDRITTEYMFALNNPYIRNPIAYALYQTWKEADKVKGKKE